jgi:GTP-binding protein
VSKRIQEPLGKKKDGPGRAKPKNFTVAAKPAQRSLAAQNEAPFNSAAFVMSVHDPRELPPPSLPELAFAGRSNAGKSSAINTLAGRRRLAFVSKTPGRTQLINFFSLGRDAVLVDLPGYGYAGVPGEVREHWKHLVGTYIATRESLAAVVVVMDIRRPLTALDRTLLEWLRDAGRRAHVLLTKSDKLSKQAQQKALTTTRRALGSEFPGTSVQLFSSLKRDGVAEAASTLMRLASGKNKAPPKGE